MNVTISQEHYWQIIEHGRRSLPLECCGLMGGKKTPAGFEILSIYEMQNLDNSGQHFSMDPKEQFAMMKQMRKAGHELVGLYHSHPSTPSRPSEEDKNLAYDEKLLYAILSLMETEPKLHVFRIYGRQQVEALPLHIMKAT